MPPMSDQQQQQQQQPTHPEQLQQQQELASLSTTPPPTLRQSQYINSPLIYRQNRDKTHQSSFFENFSNMFVKKKKKKKDKPIPPMDLTTPDATPATAAAAMAHDLENPETLSQPHHHHHRRPRRAPSSPRATPSIRTSNSNNSNNIVNINNSNDQIITSPTMTPRNAKSGTNHVKPNRNRSRKSLRSSTASSLAMKPNLTSSNNGNGYYMDSHIISDKTIMKLKHFFRYPWMVIKILISPHPGLVYPSKVIKRRARIFLMLCMLLAFACIIGTIFVSEIWYIFAPGILICLLLYIFAKFTTHHYIASFLLIATAVAINITSLIVSLNKLEIPYGIILFSWDTMILIAVSILFPKLGLSILTLLAVSFSYIGLAIYLSIKQQYRLLENYNSIGEQLRSIFVTLLLLLFYTFITSIDLLEIERKEARIQSLFKISNEALVVHKGGYITDVNPAFESMFQIKLQDILYPVQSGIWEFLPELEDLFYDSTLDTLFPPVIETTAIDAGGRGFEVEVRTNKATYAGRPVDVFSIIDITGRKNLIEADVALRKAEAANEAKVAFLTTISHELKTPINGIMASCDILEKTHMDNTQFEFLDAIKLSADYLLSLVVDILDYSKMEAGKMELVLQDFSLLKMLEDSLSMVSKSAANKHLDLVLFLESNLPVLLHGDATRVRQVLLNLISNAIKFTDEGQIKVRVRMERENIHTKDYIIQFEVEDSGIGIKAEHIPQLFAPFSQVDSSNSRRYQGTGLGLSISKRLCNMMDGDVTVKSHFGLGSTFGFTVKLGAPVTKPGFTLETMVDAMFRGEKLSGFDTPLVGPRKYERSLVGMVVDKNPWVRKSVIQYFSILNISCVEFDSDVDFRTFVQGLNTQQPTSTNPVYIVVTSIPELNAASTIISPTIDIHWILLTTDATVKHYNFENTIQKTCKFTDIIKCMFQVDKDNFDFFNESQIGKRTVMEINSAKLVKYPSPPPIEKSGDSIETSPTFNTNFVSSEFPPGTPGESSSGINNRYAPLTLSERLFQPKMSPLPNPLRLMGRDPTDQDPPQTSEKQVMFDNQVTFIPPPLMSSPYDDKENRVKKVSTETPNMQSATEDPTMAADSNNNNNRANIQVPTSSMVSAAPTTTATSSSSSSSSTTTSSAQTHSQSQAPAPKAVVETKKDLILLVEDNPINVKVFSKFLTMGGYNFKLAKNGVEAVDMTQKFDFDLVLMDCQMPLMDGFQATKTIRELESAGKINPPPMKKTPKLIIIALTANNEDRQKCLSVGMDDFLPKPASSALVIAAIKQYLEVDTKQTVEEEKK
ncbi:hypothetical protein SAMD00019534_126460 [Acytostelium subglobosum LB1]|uniref:hypothetical protein n=1 Tax=Acytostelium subglobosum LB1 TaxID=1410327 RepID=UPI0006450995|nr:hypothetical protein SAMD00019534_126460 [Acytostelium subglobosum LB1]GAM29470.1 hypothetical protein SAMD00019534_126460 [Acytostelium subglobosum LB1]|eukprot:XP_012747583.1 hypothetical protein SAMD00019534_126460 [Acytostelium subglobosum LB1]